jgi:hypothetical protein
MHSLSGHLEGAMAAVMRNHVGTDNGLSIAELARATGVSRSTAQTRRESVLSRPADDNEAWARGVPARRRNTVLGDESARFDVVVYFNDGRVSERHTDVSAARARELEDAFGVSPTIDRIDVTQR